MANNDDMLPYLLIPAIQEIDEDGYYVFHIRWAPAENVFPIAKKQCGFSAATLAHMIDGWDFFADDEGLLRDFPSLNTTMTGFCYPNRIVGDCFAMLTPRSDDETGLDIYPDLTPIVMMNLGRTLRRQLDHAVLIKNDNDPRHRQDAVYFETRVTAEA